MGEIAPGTLTAPAPLTADHDTGSFDSGEAVLDAWLKRRALKNQREGASRTYVVCAEGRVVGYYALAVGAVAHRDAIGRVRRNMPDPVPVMILARLAVDRTFQGRGLGASLLRDAGLRTLQAADTAGIRALLVHAISEPAKRFYLYFGFKESPVDPMTLMATLNDLRTALR